VGEGYESPCSDGTDTECVACSDGEYSEGGLCETASLGQWDLRANSADSRS
jgi:hypothetical protein